ncbi:UDP-glucose dehydrogenase family protein [Glycomyces paridis]|uniref:UDP-glucose 6-dehydrogenase n=1 Tax=Glycomyces paridis TaxID=2126555 RepID=A0A4S8PQ91_9ACTN|nr:UDP-glucose/GDP-mannose dehydrogenase family protein [Glycomyces paridis]THV31955.1 UDP-glucose/GDP-mannose dehydrogenase family protein [Glycomyces paridis]
MVNAIQTPSQNTTTRPRISFLGCGYLGATYAICFAELGYEVIGYDVDAAKIEAFASGVLPIHEPGLPELLKKNLETGRLRFTTDVKDVAEFADVHFICVGTPQRQGEHGADLSYIESSVVELSAHLTRKVLIVGKSTVPVGTASWVQELVDRHTPEGLGVEVGWSPEFLQESNAMHDVLRPNRIVYAAQSEWASRLLKDVHRGILELAAVEDREVPVVETDLATAELVKVAANAFLSTKISFINAMADLCEVTGGDVADLAKAIGYDQRIGNKFLRAGIGFGGGCLPKDIRALSARAGELGVGESFRFLDEVDAVNTRRRSQVVRHVADLAERPTGPNGPDLSGVRVAYLGATFKPDTDDIRDSPALAIARRLRACRADVVVYDPEGLENAKSAAPELSFVKTLAEAVAGADVVCAMVPWEEFRTLDPEALGQQVAERRILDGMNAFDPAQWTKHGWTYKGIGR